MSSCNPNCTLKLTRTSRDGMEKLMKQRLNDNPELINSLMPSYQPWCRRLTPGDGYLEALQESNARLVDHPIEEITATGIRTVRGDEADFDVIVAATGFVNTRVPPWKMVGRNSVTLAQRFEKDADGYLSVAAPSMPNYFSIGCGPNFTIANGPLLSAFGFITEYILQWALKIAEEDIHSVCPKDNVVEAYNIYIQQVLRRTAWNRECESWYKKGRKDEYRTGITAIYPGSMMHFKSMLEKIRPEDFDIKYRSANPFKFYGCGLTALDMSSDQPDLSGYLAHTMKLDSIM